MRCSTTLAKYRIWHTSMSPTSARSVGGQGSKQGNWCCTAVLLVQLGHTRHKGKVAAQNHSMPRLLWPLSTLYAAPTNAKDPPPVHQLERPVALLLGQQPPAQPALASRQAVEAHNRWAAGLHGPNLLRSLEQAGRATRCNQCLGPSKHPPPAPCAGCMLRRCQGHQSSLRGV